MFNQSQKISPLIKPLNKYVLKPSLFVLVLFLGLRDANVKAQETSDTSLTSSLSWSTKKINTGIYWKSYQGDNLFNSRQSINLVELFLDSVTTELKVAFFEDSLTKTSKFATHYNALVAVNGSFFRSDTGGPAVFLKVDGTVIHKGHVNRNPFNERGAIGWSSNQPAHILKKPEDGWLTSPYENILSSGPLLIFDSQIQSFNNNPFHQNRQPRTAVAITNDRRLILVTIDGRSFQAYGMTIPELANFLLDLGADDALNLDGGGSTSMWIRNMTENGIVNYPSDNLKFDHEGERDVANALLILSSNE